EEHRSLPREGEQEPEPTYKVRRIVRITERTIDRKGQALLIPEVTLEGWWTSLDDAFDADTVIGCTATMPPASSSTANSRATLTWNGCRRASSTPTTWC